MAIKRIDYYGKFEPTGPDFSTAKRFQALSGLADQVGETAVQLGQIALKERATKAAKAGALAGAQVERDEEGNIIAPELQEDNTIYGQAFRESAINAYKSGISLDARKRLDELAEQYKDDPIAYKKEADAYKSGVIQSLPLELQVEVAPTLDEDIYFREKVVRKNFTDNEFNKNLAILEENVSSLENEILYAARNGDVEQQQALQTRLNKLLADNVALVDPTKAQGRLDALAKNVAEETYLGEIDEIANNEYLSLPERLARTENLLSELRNTEFLADLTPDEKRALESQIDGRVNDLRVQLAKEQSTRTSAQALEVSELEIDAKNGRRLGDEIIRDANRLFRDGVINGDERTSIINNVYSQQEKNLDKNNRILDVSERIKGDSTVVVTQQGIDDYYDDMLEPQLEGVEDKSLVQANYINSTRMIPTKIKRQVNQYLSSGDPQLITEAAVLIDRVDEIPGMFDAMVPPSAKIFATNMTRLMGVMSPEKAYEQSKQLLGGELDRARIELRQSKIKDEKYPEKYEKWTKNVVGDVGALSMGLATRQYQTIFESYYLNGADEDTAKEQAEKFLSTNYGDSIFGTMMYPPEQYYTLGGDIEYMKDQIYDSISGLTDIYGEIDPDSIMLLSDDVTARTASEGRPMYKVSFLDEFGLIQTTNEYFMPDIESAKQKKIDEAEQRINEARALTPIQEKLEQDRINKIIEDETGVRPERSKTEVKPASEIYKDVTVFQDYPELVKRGLEIATTPQRMAAELVGEVGEAIGKKGEASRKRIQQEAERRAKEEARIRAEARKGAK